MNHFAAVLTLTAAVQLSSVPVSLAGTDQHIAISPEQLATWMILRGDSAPPGVKQKMKEIDDSFEIVFIPGIMGSNLKIGQYQFGEGKIDAKSIVLTDPNVDAPAEIMDQYSAFWSKFDVYRPGLVLLGIGSKGRQIKTFAYDWRMDLDKTIDKFQEYAKRELSGKHVIVVAHSTGAMLAWHWKNNYGPREKGTKLGPRKFSRKNIRGERPFDLAALVVVGAPLRGSCEVTKMLVEGYSADSSGSLLEKFGIGQLFAGAHPAVFTFPSVFELLPPSGGCLKVKNGSHYDEQDLLKIGTWHNDGYSAIRTFAERAGFANKRDYLSLVSGAIEAASRFKAKFDQRQGDDRVFFLYSQKYPMQSSYLAEARGDWLRLITGAVSTDRFGDGRVTKESAFPESPDGVIGQPWPLTNGHDKLIGDQKFQEFLADVLGRYIKQREVILLAAEFRKDPSLASEMDAIGWIISPGTIEYASSPEVYEAQRSIARYNASLFRNLDSDAQSALVKAAKQYHNAREDWSFWPERSWTTPGDTPRNLANREIQSALLESAIVLAPGKLSPDVLITLARHKAEQGMTDEAVAYAVQAKDILERDALASKENKALALFLLNDLYGSVNASQYMVQTAAKLKELGFESIPSRAEAQVRGPNREF